MSITVTISVKLTTLYILHLRLYKNIFIKQYLWRLLFKDLSHLVYGMSGYSDIVLTH